MFHILCDLSKGSATEDNIIKDTSSPHHARNVQISFSSNANDPMHHLPGDNEISAVCNIVLCLFGIQPFFLDIFLWIFSVGTNLYSALDREQLFAKFHQARLSEAFIRSYMFLFGTLAFISRGICGFLNILMMGLIANAIKVQVKIGLQNSVIDQQRISER